MNTDTTNTSTMRNFFTHNYRRFAGKNLLLVLLFAVIGLRGVGQAAYNMSSANYSLDFADIANWTDNFAAGTGASNWGAVAINATGTIPDGVKTTVSSAGFATSTSSGGIQRGSLLGNVAGTLVFLSTGTTSNGNSVAADLYLNFTGRTAGTLSFDYACVFNSTGNRGGTLKIYTTTDGTSWTELTAASVSVVNNVASSGSKTTLTLPSGFNGSSTARIRFYEYADAIGSTGSRPKISIDNVAVTSTATGTPALAISGTPTAHGPVCPNVSASSVQYTITNSGTAATNVVVSSSDAQFVVSGLSSTSISAAGTATFNVTFTPTSAGSKTATITSFYNTSTASGTIGLTGTGTTAVTAAVTGSAASSITSSTATLNGNVITLGVCPASTQKGFVYSLTSANADPLNGGTGVTTVPVGTIVTGAYTQSLTGLSSSTGYSYKAYVFNGASYTYSTVQTFSTTGALSISGSTNNHGSVCPAVSASPITYTITNSGAVPVAGIAAVSSGTNAADFVVSGLSSTSIAAGGTATYVVTFTPSSAGSKSATITVSSTTSGIASITSSLTGTGTTPVAAAATSSAATLVTGTSATLNGSITLGVCPASTIKGFVYSITSVNATPIISGTGVLSTSATASAGSFTAALTGLNTGTNYSFRAYVYDGTTYTYSAIQTFTTTTPPANDECTGAIGLTLAASATTGTVTNASQSIVSCNGGNADDDVWYSFTTSNAGTYTITVTGSASFDAVAELFSGTCVGLTSISSCTDATGVGGIETIVAAGLSASTTYFVRVYDFNTGTPTTPTFTIAVTPPVPPAPAATAATSLTDISFTANWGAVTQASNGYLLDVSTSSTFGASGTPTTLTENFTTYTSATSFNGFTLPSGTSNYTTAASSGPSGPNSVQFNLSGGQILSPVLSGPASQLSFWTRSNGLNSATLLVEGYNGTTWTTIQNIAGSSILGTSGPAGGTTFTYNSGTTPALPANITQFRLTLTKSSGNMALDDVSINYTPFVASFVTGYNAKAITGQSTASSSVTGLTQSTTYYYRLRAVNGTGNSANSNTITVTTNPSPTITGATTTAVFTTTYGTASAVQSFSVSGIGLTANLIATAPTGFEVSSDGTTYGSTTTFTQTAGSASGSLRIRLSATATVAGSYNSQNIVLSSTGATSVNITTPATGNSVAAKALTITASNQTKVYGTVASLGTTAFTTSGLVNSDAVTSITLTSATGSPATATVAGSPYSIVPSAATGTGLGNYTITYTNGSLTVTTAPLTITANNGTKVYGQTFATGAGSANFSSNGLVNSETIGSITISSTGAVSTASVGTYPIVPSAATGGTFTAANYAITYTNGTLTVTGLSITTADFRSQADGNFSAPATWQYDRGGADWVTATAAPVSTNKVDIYHTVTLDQDFTVGPGKRINLNTAPTQGSLIIGPTSTLSMTDASSAINFNGRPVTVKSTVAGTGSFGKLPGALSNATNITVERYITGTTQRAWRLLAVPTVSTSQTIKQAWQENQAALVLGTANLGTQITGNYTNVTASQALGFDDYTPSTSLLTYDVTGNAYVRVANTNSKLIGTEPGYLLYVRGDRSKNKSSATTDFNETVLRTNGSINQGNISKTILAGKNAVVGNPYVSAIDLTQVTIAGGSVGTTINVWDPKLGTVGGYQKLTPNNATPPTAYSITPGFGSYGVPPGTNVDTIESGMAFFVNAPGTTDGTISFTENSKVAGKRQAFRPASPAAAEQRFFTNINSIATTGDRVLDGIYINLDDANNNGIDNFDSKKQYNFNENIAVKTQGVNLGVEKRKPFVNNDTVFFNTTSLRRTTYQLYFKTDNLDANLVATLEDTYLKTSTLVNPNGTSTYDFSVDANAGSAATDRFRVVFKELGSGPLPVTFTSIKAAEQNNNIAVEWKVGSQLNVARYEVEKSTDGRTFTKVAAIDAANTSTYNWLDLNAVQGNNFYRVRAIDINAVFKYTQIVKVTLGKKGSAIAVSPNPVQGNTVTLQFTNQQAGKYQLNLTNAAGQLMYSNTLQHAGGSSSQTFTLSSQITRGAYQLEVIAPDKTRKAQKLIVL